MAWLAGGVLAAAAYCGLFLALSSLTRHAVVVGLLFAFFWEGLMASLLTGIRWLSVSAWATQLASSVDDGVDAAGPGVGSDVRRLRRGGGRAGRGLVHRLPAAGLLDARGDLSPLRAAGGPRPTG